MNNVGTNNELWGMRYKTSANVYKTGNTGSGNVLGVESWDANVVIKTTVQTRTDTPYPPWLVGAATPAGASSVGMGTGASHAP